MFATSSSTYDGTARGPDRAGGRSPRRRGVRAALAALVALMGMAFAAPAAKADPWVCDGAGYVVQEDATSTGGQVWFQRADRQPDGTYALTRLATLPSTRSQNALGFRAQDGFMYAWNQDNDNITRIGFDPLTGRATFDDIGAPAGAPPNYNTVVGTFLADGTYIVFGSYTDPLGNLVANALVIDVTTTPTPTVIRTLTPTWDAVGSPRYSFPDWAVSPANGNLYVAATDNTTGAAGVYRVQIAGNQISFAERIADASGTGGAQWFSPYGDEGTLVVYRNNVDLIGIDLQANQESFLGDAPDVAGVDGTACANGLALTKDVDPRTVTAGSELTYTYELTSRALATAPVDFADQLPAGMTYVPGSVTVNPPFGTVNNYGGTDTLSITGTLAPQQTATISARVRVAPDHPCNVDADNQAQSTLRVPNLPPVTINSNDPDTPADPTDATTVHVNCSADVDVVKTASTSPIVPGEDATFSLVVTNRGPSTARNVAVRDQLPAEFSFTSASEGCAEASGTVTCTVASLAPGASQTFTVTGDVASSLDECLENTATVTSATPDPNPANNSSTICAPIRGESNLSISKVASTGTVPPGGGQVMYTIVVENEGPSDDTGVKVSDPLDPRLTLVAAEPSQGACTTTNNTVSCDLGTLKDEGSAQVLVTVNVAAGAGCVPNTARVQGAHVDPDPAGNQAAAQVCTEPPPTPPTTFDLDVDKRASVGRPYVGQRVTYTVVVRNNGPDAAPQAKLTDTYNNRATVVSVRSSQGTCTRQMPVTCELGRIEAGARATVTVVIRPREAGGARNAASATSCCGTDGDPSNNMDTADIRARKVTVRLSKVASRDVVRSGETFSYRIRLRNPTGGQARNLRVCDRLPSGLSYVSSQPRARRQGSRQRCWTISRLGARKSRTFRVTVRAARGANGRVTNRATVTSPDVKQATARDRVQVRGLATPVTG